MASSLETANLSLEAAGHEPGIKRFSKRFGPLEERTLIIDSEKLLAWAGEDGESDDIMRIDGPFELGDSILGGYVKVLDAGGEANAVIDVGLEGATTIVGNEIDPDAAAGTVKAGANTHTVVTSAETFLDAVVSGAAAITEAEPAVLQVTYYVLRGNEAWKSAKAYTGAYVGDPNDTPQVPATAEA